MNKVTLGIIGAGRACELHLNAYRKVHSIEVCIKYICDTDIYICCFRKAAFSNRYSSCDPGGDPG